MPNPLYNAIAGAAASGGADGSSRQSMKQNAPQVTMQDAMRQLKQDPSGMIRQAGYNVPEEYANNPQSAAMYLIQSGQVGGPLMRRIQPMLNMLMGRR